MDLYYLVTLDKSMHFTDFLYRRPVLPRDIYIAAGTTNVQIPDLPEFGEHRGRTIEVDYVDCSHNGEPSEPTIRHASMSIPPEGPVREFISGRIKTEAGALKRV
jgi:hypothetical protein